MSQEVVLRLARERITDICTKLDPNDEVYQAIVKNVIGQWEQLKGALDRYRGADKGSRDAVKLLDITARIQQMNQQIETLEDKVYGLDDVVIPSASAPHLAAGGLPSSSSAASSLAGTPPRQDSQTADDLAAVSGNKRTALSSSSPRMGRPRSGSSRGSLMLRPPSTASIQAPNLPRNTPLTSATSSTAQQSSTSSSTPPSPLTKPTPNEVPVAAPRVLTQVSRSPGVLRSARSNPALPIYGLSSSASAALTKPRPEDSTRRTSSSAQSTPSKSSKSGSSGSRKRHSSHRPPSRSHNSSSRNPSEKDKPRDSPSSSYRRREPSSRHAVNYSAISTPYRRSNRSDAPESDSIFANGPSSSSPSFRLVPKSTSRSPSASPRQGSHDDGYSSSKSGSSRDSNRDRINREGDRDSPGKYRSSRDRDRDRDRDRNRDKDRDNHDRDRIRDKARNRDGDRKREDRPRMTGSSSRQNIPSRSSDAFEEKRRRRRSEAPRYRRPEDYHAPRSEVLPGFHPRRRHEDSLEGSMSLDALINDVISEHRAEMDRRGSTDVDDDDRPQLEPQQDPGAGTTVPSLPTGSRVGIIPLKLGAAQNPTAKGDIARKSPIRSKRSSVKLRVSSNAPLSDSGSPRKQRRSTLSHVPDSIADLRALLEDSDGRAYSLSPKSQTDGTNSEDSDNESLSSKSVVVVDVKTEVDATTPRTASVNEFTSTSTGSAPDGHSSVAPESASAASVESPREVANPDAVSTPTPPSPSLEVPTLTIRESTPRSEGASPRVSSPHEGDDVDSSINQPIPDIDDIPVFSLLVVEEIPNNLDDPDAAGGAPAPEIISLEPTPRAFPEKDQQEEEIVPVAFNPVTDSPLLPAPSNPMLFPNATTENSPDPLPKVEISDECSQTAEPKEKNREEKHRHKDKSRKDKDKDKSKHKSKEKSKKKHSDSDAQETPIPKSRRSKSSASMVARTVSPSTPSLESPKKKRSKDKEKDEHSSSIVVSDILDEGKSSKPSKKSRSKKTPPEVSEQAPATVDTSPTERSKHKTKRAVTVVAPASPRVELEEETPEKKLPKRKSKLTTAVTIAPETLAAADAARKAAASELPSKSERRSSDKRPSDKPRKNRSDSEARVINALEAEIELLNNYLVEKMAIIEEQSELIKELQDELQQRENLVKSEKREIDTLKTMLLDIRTVVRSRSNTHIEADKPSNRTALFTSNSPRSGDAAPIAPLNISVRHLSGSNTPISDTASPHDTQSSTPSGMVSPKPSMLEKITHHQRGNSFGAVQEAVSPRESSNALDALVQVDSSPPAPVDTVRRVDLAGELTESRICDSLPGSPSLDWRKFELHKSPLKLAFEEFEDENKNVPGAKLLDLFRYMGIVITPEKLASLLKTIHADETTQLVFADVLTLHRSCRDEENEEPESGVDLSRSSAQPPLSPKKKATATQ